MAAMLIWTVGCGARDGDGAALLQALGVVEAPTPPPIVVDVLCDASTGSTCTRTVLESTLDVVLSAVVTRPVPDAPEYKTGRVLTRISERSRCGYRCAKANAM